MIDPRIVHQDYPALQRSQWRCTVCGCHVAPHSHQPDSDECQEARRERIISQSD